MTINPPFLSLFLNITVFDIYLLFFPHVCAILFYFIRRSWAGGGKKTLSLSLSLSLLFFHSPLFSSFAFAVSLCVS
jgi:hypothetical protein